MNDLIIRKTFIFLVCLMFCSVLIQANLDSLEIKTNDKYCIDEYYKIEIIPMDNSGNFVEITNLFINFNETIEYYSGPIFNSSDRYITSIKINSYNESFEFATLMIEAVKDRQTVNEEVELEVLQNCEDGFFENLISNVDIFVYNHWIFLVTVSGMLLFILLVIAVIKHK